MLQTQLDQLRQSGADTGHTEFAARMVRALTEAATALAALPDDDGFWRDRPDRQVSPYNLHCHAAERLRRDPGDRAARWSMVALALALGANDGGLEHLGPEIAADPAVVADAVVIADWIWEQIGLDPTGDLRALCAQADRPALEALARTADGTAARTALRVLDGGSFIDWAAVDPGAAS
ncbi:hypothetical protein [Kitasatospora viridis]|uniref:Uncharacterized protein n=1 Tax=Kitasatospora viridis TaxID=281105 RepID=A0A561SDW8_9ACTN|nr:hypothetical protein [Kitasatospora viridis]TWF73059.1 hypothetical protein FHX73_16210 [Kitasatospora viridis]